MIAMRTCCIALALVVGGRALAQPSAAPTEPPSTAPQPPPPGGSGPPLTDNIDEALLHLQVAVIALQERMFSDDAIAAASVTTVLTQVDDLQDLFAAPQSSSYEADYARSLDRAANAIAAAAATPDSEAANASLGLLQRDFRAKIETARATLGASGRDPTAIQVVVTTTRRGRPVRGYLIRASDAIDGDAPPTHIFNNETNPSTTAWLVPGIYFLHLFRGTRWLRRQEFDIDERSSTLTMAVSP